MDSKIQWTRVKSDINGNPRFVCHYMQLLTQGEKEEYSKSSLWSAVRFYSMACKRANKLGGRKFHNKQFGGGIVFSSYCLEELEADINRILEEAK